MTPSQDRQGKRQQQGVCQGRSWVLTPWTAGTGSSPDRSLQMVRHYRLGLGTWPRAGATRGLWLPTPHPLGSPTSQRCHRASPVSRQRPWRAGKQDGGTRSPSPHGPQSQALPPAVWTAQRRAPAGEARDLQGPHNLPDRAPNEVARLSCSATEDAETPLCVFRPGFLSGNRKRGFASTARKTLLWPRPPEQTARRTSGSRTCRAASRSPCVGVRGAWSLSPSAQPSGRAVWPGQRPQGWPRGFVSGEVPSPPVFHTGLKGGHVRTDGAQSQLPPQQPVGHGSHPLLPTLFRVGWAGHPQRPRGGCVGAMCPRPPT